MPDISTVKDLPDISFIEYKTVDDVKANMVADYEAYMTCLLYTSDAADE